MTRDNVGRDQLQSFVRRVEALEDEIKVLNQDKSEIYKEAKGNGFDTKVLRKVIAARRMDASERNEQDAMFDLYWDAIHGVAHAHVEIIEEFGSRAKAANAVSRGDDVGELQHSSEPGKAEAVEPGRQISASADADPAPYPSASGNGFDGAPEGQGETGAGTAGATPATGAFPEHTSAPDEPASAGADAASTPPPRSSFEVFTRTHNPATHFLNSEGRERLHGCLKPDMCGSQRPHGELCWSCAARKPKEDAA